MQIKIDSSQKEVKEHGAYGFPFLVSFEKLSTYESGSFLWHWHKEIELTLITSGEMIYQVNNRSFHLKKGQALFGNSGTLHTGSMCESKSDCEYTSITFAPQLLYGTENSIIYTKYMKALLTDLTCPAICFDLSEEWHKEIIASLCTIISLDQKKEAGFEFEILMELLSFWKCLSLHYNTLETRTDTEQEHFDRIRNIILYIEKNYDSDLTLDDISEYVHISRSACSRLFKKHMGLSLFEYINQYRIEKSMEYLKSGSYAVTDVARLVGFNDSNYYSKVFHKYKGCSPREYLKTLMQ